MLEFLKNYYIFMLVLMVFSYLVPKEEYKIYIQFFISIFIIVLLVKPIMEVFSLQGIDKLYDMFAQFQNQVDNLELEVREGEDIFEYFFSKGQGE